MRQLKTHSGLKTVSTPEATMMDICMFLKRSGGLGHVATVLDELAEVLRTHVANKERNVVPLVPYYSVVGAKRDATSRVAINATIESDVPDTD